MSTHEMIIDPSLSTTVDKCVSREELVEMFDDIKKYIMVSTSSENIKYIKNPDDDLSMMSLTDNPMNIRYIKEPTIEMWNAAINNNPCSIQYLLSDGWKPVHVYGLFKMAIEKDPSVIQYAYKHFDEADISLYHDLCQRAFNIDNNTCCWFVDPPLDLLINMMQIFTNASYFEMLCDEKFDNTIPLFDRILTVLNLNSYNSMYIEKCGRLSDDEKYKLYMEAVGIFSDSIRYVPYEKRTEELCTKAFNKNTIVWKHIPNEYRTTEMYIKVIDKYPSELPLFPDETDASVYKYFIKQCKSDKWKFRRDWKMFKKHGLGVRITKILKDIGFYKVK